MINTNNMIKIFVIVIACSMLDILFHAIASQFSSSIPDGWNQSVIVQIIGFQATVIIWALIAFGTAAYLFFKYQKHIPGAALSRGLQYGTIIGLIWFWGNIENHAISGMALTHEIIMAICDGIPMVILGYLLSRIPAARNVDNQIRKISISRNSVMIASAITVTFVVFRYLAYMTGLISSGYDTRAAATLVWTIVMGLIPGALYLIVQSSFQYDSPLKGAVKLGMLFGGVWLSFSIMIPLAFAGLFKDIALRCAVDILAVVSSYYLANSLIRDRVLSGRIGAAS